VVVTGFVSSIVVVVGCDGGVTGLYGSAFPSTPVDGSGDGWPWPAVAGASDFVAGGSVIAGGAF